MSDADLSSSTILIVDDQQANVDLLEQILAMHEYRKVTCTTDSRQVTSICKKINPDLILLDLHMPYLTGTEVIEQLRSLVSNSYLPILVLTADITPEAKRQALQAGASDFLSKPFDVTEVLLRVRNLLETRFLYLQVQNQNSRLEETVRARTRALEDAQKALVLKNEELSSALAKASEVAELKSQFLANINHEIRTPINGILGMINLLTESELNADQRECTGMLKSSADWLVKVMNDILDVSQLGAGTAIIEHRVFDPRVLLEELSAVYRSRAHAKGIKFSSTVTPSIPRLLSGDQSSFTPFPPFSDRMERSRVILVENHKPSQTAYTALLEPEFEVVGVLDDASRLLPHVSETQPNIVILDIALPGKSGFQAGRELREYFPQVNIIFLTTNQAFEYVQEAFALGASAYVLKMSAASDLPAAIRAALEGKRFISSLLSKDEPGFDS